MKLNQQGYKKAKSMIESNQYVLDSDWSDVQPSSEKGNEYIDRHDWDAYGKWHLGIDETQDNPNTKDHYGFPFGDFSRVHRDSLIAAKQRAAQQDYSDIEEAADQLLSMIDEE